MAAPSSHQHRIPCHSAPAALRLPLCGCPSASRCPSCAAPPPSAASLPSNAARHDRPSRLMAQLPPVLHCHPPPSTASLHRRPRLRVHCLATSPPPPPRRLLSGITVPSPLRRTATRANCNNERRPSSPHPVGPPLLIAERFEVGCTRPSPPPRLQAKASTWVPGSWLSGKEKGLSSGWRHRGPPAPEVESLAARPLVSGVAAS
mgnify:CR=1 FL=1